MTLGDYGLKSALLVVEKMRALNKTAGLSGYVFYESGRTQLAAPFCQEHLEKAPEYATPVFENQAALDIFRQMFPVTYLQDVKGKPLLFFGTRITAKSNSGC